MILKLIINIMESASNLSAENIKAITGVFVALVLTFKVAKSIHWRCKNRQ